MKRLASILLAAAFVAAGCGEKPQTTATAAGKRADARAYEGVSSPYAAGQWSAGDRASWEEQMRRRAQTQNEYLRVQAK